MGNELTPTSVKDIPKVEWNADANEFYTLLMVDPDALSRANPIFRPIEHWTVVNIPSSDDAKGDQVSISELDRQMEADFIVTYF